MSARTAQSTEALDAVGDSLRSLLAASRRLRGRETHAHHGLSYAHYSLLFGLADAEERSASALARDVDLAPPTVTQMLDALEARGLVERRRAHHDRRVVLTRLTELGEAVVAERRAQIEPQWLAALGDVSDDELLAAAAVMERISGFLDDLHERGEPV
ncbi:MAG: hypothetical protein QOF76_3556 [Solirubrobacteraceae bacterium]|nr:hypothetical protein [Solirubrobacteraceae bacterium]